MFHILFDAIHYFFLKLNVGNSLFFFHASNPAHGEVYSIQHYVLKFVSDLRKVGSFLWVLRFPPPIKLTTKIYLKYC